MNLIKKRVNLNLWGEDNNAAFAFAILGADVTSTDISERQLENAAVIAEKLKLSIEFICDDTMHLENINDWRSNPMAALPARIAIVSQK